MCVCVCVWERRFHIERQINWAARSVSVQNEKPSDRNRKKKTKEKQLESLEQSGIPITDFAPSEIRQNSVKIGKA